MISRGLQDNRGNTIVPYYVPIGFPITFPISIPIAFCAIQAITHSLP